MKILAFQIGLLLCYAPNLAQANTCLNARQINQQLTPLGMNPSWQTVPGYQITPHMQNLRFQYSLWVQEHIICHYQYGQHKQYLAIMYTTPITSKEYLIGPWQHPAYYTYNPNIKICRSSLKACQF